MFTRKHFLQLSALALLAAALPKGITMLDELLVKIATKQDLTPGELEELRQQSKTLSDVLNIAKAWRGNDNHIVSSFIDFPFIPIVSQVFEQNRTDYTVQIPSQYKHLFVMGSFRTTEAGASGTIVSGQFNGDTGASSYAIQRLTGAVSTVSAAMDNTYDRVHFGAGASDGAAAGENGFFVAFVPNYSSSVFYKSVLNLEGVFINSSPSGAVSIFASQWYNTAPIKTIRFFPDSDSLKAGSLFSVYAIQ